MAALLTADTFIDETITVEVETVKSMLQVGLKDKDGKKLGVMLYFNGNVPTDSMERELCNLTVKGMNFRDPVYVEPITGKVLQLAVDKGCQLPDEVKFYNVPLWDAPVFIMEKSLVPMQEPAKEALKAGGSNKESMF